jgi:mycofactocin system FadH/OYE family oxidoreductase 2
MAPEFKYLFTPLQIGPVTIRNRIVQTAHAKQYEDFFDNYCLTSERNAWYYAERAKGGAGLLIMEEQMVHPTSTGGIFRLSHGYRREAIPRYKMVADMVHEFGGTIFAQINHVGFLCAGDQVDDYHQVWAPSAIPGLSPNVKIAKEMEVEDIKEVVAGFAQTAVNVKEGGLDGVELHGAHGYLIWQFLSPICNKRTDEYGGNLENRMRFLLEVIDAVRVAVGSEFVVGIRINGDEFSQGGLVLEDTKEICKRLEATGKIDYISVSAGQPWDVLPMRFAVPMSFPPGFYVHLAAGIKEAVKSIPISCIGRISDPVMAEQILANGQADMVGMTRALICDPELPNKAREGRLDDIRRCMACNQGCSMRGWASLPVGCIQNPAAGREKRLGIGSLKPASRAKKVMVIGGGPAGLKAAEIAARRGHKVVLYEKEQELGGQVRLAAKTPTRAEFGEAVRYLITQVNKLGVEIHLGVEVELGTVQAVKPDAIVVATGLRTSRVAFSPSRLVEEEIPGADQENVVTVWDVLSEKVQVGQRVVLVDGDETLRAVGTAEWLAERGKEVEIVTYQPVVGMLISWIRDPFFTNRLAEKGVKVITNSEVRKISGNVVVVYDGASKVEKKIEGVDTVVWAEGYKANDELYFQLKDRFPSVRRIGDCAAPRSLEFAIWEGEEVGRAL